MAKENPSWGYDRIVGALVNLGFLLSDQTVGNILRRHGLSPAPKRKQAICWKDFIRSHMEVLVGTGHVWQSHIYIRMRAVWAKKSDNRA
jgi:putative transposase